MKFTKDVTNLITRLPSWSEKCHHYAVSILELERMRTEIQLLEEPINVQECQGCWHCVANGIESHRDR